MSHVSRRTFLSQASALAGVAAISDTRTLAQSQTSTPFAHRTATELAGLIRTKEISAEELTRYFIGRIERFDREINAVVARDFERAMDAARSADAALGRSVEVGPLHGVPMTIKESYDLAGLPTTWGFPRFADNIASVDADVVTRFKQAGAHFLGKTNVPIALGDYQSYNDIYGTTSNPWDLTRTPGGSSGGSAAALAAGLCALESGSDIGGSIRNPAHYCGVYGHKPTWGIVSRRGQALPGRVSQTDLAVVGPMARCAEDLSLAMGIVTGPDALDAPGWRLELPPPRARRLSDLRVAVWPTHELSPPSNEISGRIQQLADMLGRLGATVSDSVRPDFSPSHHHATYTKLLGSVTGANVGDEQFAQARRLAGQFDRSDDSWPAISAQAAVLHHRDWLESNNERTHIRLAWRRFFSNWDLVLCPIMATTAFPHDQRARAERTLAVDGVAAPAFGQSFWAGLATLGYLPSTVFPTGPSTDGLPIGLQAIGPAYHDNTPIEFARLMADEIGGFTPPPGYGD